MTLAIINRSSLADTQVSAIAAAIQKNQRQSVALAWALPAPDIVFVASVEQPDPSHQKLWVQSGASALEGALGYHVDTSGLPEAFVYPEADALYGVSVSVTIGHEADEMFIDPLANRTMQQDQIWYSVEVADPVESDADGIMVDGILLSNSVTPAYFGFESGSRYDLRDLLTGPCAALRPGGYLGWSDGTQWHQTFARKAGGRQSYRATRSGRSAWRAAQPRKTL